MKMSNLHKLLYLENLNLLSITFDSCPILEILLTLQKLLICTESLWLTKIYILVSLNVLPRAYMKHLKNFLIQFAYENAREIQNLLQSGFRSLQTICIWLFKFEKIYFPNPIKMESKPQKHCELSLQFSPLLCMWRKIIKNNKLVMKKKKMASSIW